MMTRIIILIIISIIIYAIYRAIKGVISRTFELKRIDDKATIEDLPESHSFSNIVTAGSAGTENNISRLYEELCVLHPLKNKNDPRIPGIVKKYQDIINGKIDDPEGINTPSMYLLNRLNPDYETYIKNQARLGYSSSNLKEEVSRIKNKRAERDVRNMFFARLVSEGIPISVVCSAVTDAKIDSFGADDWKKFIKAVKIYIQAADEYVVSDFVETFDDKEIILDHKKFEKYVVFKNNKVPNETIIEIIKERITIDQAYRMLNLVDNFQYTWDEAVEEILSDDHKEKEENDLRKKYHWNG